MLLSATCNWKRLRSSRAKSRVGAACQLRLSRLLLNEPVAYSEKPAELLFPACDRPFQSPGSKCIPNSPIDRPGRPGSRCYLDGAIARSRLLLSSFWNAKAGYVLWDT